MEKLSSKYWEIRCIRKEDKAKLKEPYFYRKKKMHQKNPALVLKT